MLCRSLSYRDLGKLTATSSSILELVADRIITFAEIIDRENVIVGTDCGLGSRVHSQIASAKLRDSAALASMKLWSRIEKRPCGLNETKKQKNLDVKVRHLISGLDLRLDAGIYSADADPVHPAEEVHPRPDRMARG